MKKRNLVIGLLVTLAVALTGATFAFWAGGISNADITNTGTITIGDADAVTTAVSTSDYVVAGSSLVPVGYEDAGDSEVSSVDLEFVVMWNGTGAEGALGTLNVTVDSVVISGGASDGQEVEVGAASSWDLFTVDLSNVTGVAVVNGTATGTLLITVTFTNEPADAAQYAAIATNSIIVTLSFDVTAA